MGAGTLYLNNNLVSISSTGDITTGGDIQADAFKIIGCVRKNGMPVTFCDAPYGAWYDVTDQTIGASGADSAIKFNTTYLEQYITLAANDTDLTFTYSGKYLITFSAIFQSTAVTKKGAVWFTHQNAPIADSGTDFVLLGNGADRVVTVTLIEEFDAGDNLSLRWYGETTNVFLNTNAATGHIPRVLCIILTINLIGL